MTDCQRCREARRLGQGRHSRREVMLGAVALGVSARALGLSAVAAQEDPAPARPAYLPEPESEILLPIDEPLTPETVSFRVLTARSPEVTDYDDNFFTRWLEEKTNVHVEWDLVPEEDIQSKLNVMLSSGDIPEIIFGFVSPSQLLFYGSQGLFIPLNDLIAEHAPRTQKILEVYPFAADVVSAPDGTMYAMPAVGHCYHCSMAQKLWIYQPWLDALGLEMPQTTAEFEQVLRAFKEQDPNGNGEADEIPLSTSLTGWNGELPGYFMNSFISNPGPPYLILQEGAVTPIYNTPQWREGLRYLHGLYEQGLLDPQSFTQGEDQIQQLGNNPDEVILGSVLGGSISGVVSLEADPEARWTQYVTVPPLEGPEGVRYAYWNAYAGPFAAAVITSSCKDPALAVRWIDSLYWQEATLRQDRGVLGEDWRWAEEGELDIEGRQAIWKLLVTFADPTNHSWQGTGPLYFSERLFSSAAVDPETIAFDLEAILHTETKEKYEPYQQPRDMVLPPLAFTEEQAFAIADPEATIGQYVTQMVASFVRGETDIDAGWDQYVSTLDQMGLAAYVQAYQDAYDAKYGQ